MPKSFYVLLLFSFNLFADQVQMKNGDRLSGAIVKLDGKNLTLKSEYAGPITFPWEAVAAITSSEPLNIGLSDGQVVVGTVTTSADNLSIQTKDTGAVTTPRQAVKFIRSKDEQAAYEAHEERYRNPRLLDLWAGTVGLGFAKTQGNSKTTNLNINTAAVRATLRDKTSVYFTSLYASDRASGKSVNTANAKRGGLKYELNVSSRTFVYGAMDFEADQFQSLDLRFVPGGGFGLHAIKNEKSIFDIFGGGSLDREYYSTGLTRSFAEAQVGEEFTHKYSSVTTLHQRLTFFPNLSSRGDFRFNLDAAADTKLRKWLAWQVAVSNRYLTNPIRGTQKNDLIVTTGLNLSFAK